MPARCQLDCGDGMEGVDLSARDKLAAELACLRCFRRGEYADRCSEL
ncbi:MAG: hypothetical protein ACLTZT_08615 [Butyricimonas faecalis]